MPSQQVCSPTYQRGFINLAGNLTLQSLTTQQNISPFTASFAPRNIAPTLYSNFVDETNQNTLLYNSYRYTLVPSGVQFVKPSHVGLIPQSIGGTPELELIFTYYTYQSMPVSEPNVIILVVPIFSVYENKHAAYIRQFIDSDKYPAASVQTVFFENKGDKSQSSISYNTSVQLVNDNKQAKECVNMRVFYYPNGIRMTGQDFYNFKTVLTQSDKLKIDNYMLPYYITRGSPVATDYDQLTNKITTISSSFNLPVSQITVADIGNKLEYFKLPMSLSGTKDFSSSCPYYKTDQYKCVPFHRLTDLSGNEVIKDANTLADIMKEQDEANNQGSTVSIQVIFGYMGLVVGIVVTIIFLGWFVRYLSSAKPPGAAAAVAAVAVTAAAVATATPSTATPAPPQAAAP
jgi:hypothetical protein